MMSRALISRGGALRYMLLAGIATGVLAALLGLRAATASAGVLDQNQPEHIGETVIWPNTSRAQTFTAGITGTMDEVLLSMRKEGTPTAPLTIEIRDTVGGNPGPTVLASNTFPASSVPDTLFFTSLAVPVSVPVTAGTRYAIVAHSSSTVGNSYYWGSHGDKYPRGTSFYTSTPGGDGPWTDYLIDMTFATYVVPAPGAGNAATPGTATATTTGLRAAALRRCLKKTGKARKKCKKKARKLPV